MSSADAADVASADPPSKKPLYKNPWFWGVLACLIYPPCIRPFTRTIVEAPAPTSEPVSAGLQRPDGGAFGVAQLEERIHIAAFVDGDGSECPEPVEALKPMVARLDQQAYAGRGFLARNAGFGDDIRVLVVAGFGEGSEVDLAGLEGRCELATDRWVLAGGTDAEVRAVAAQIEGVEAAAVTLLSHRRMTILGFDRRARGLYGMDELGQDEVYHRARHVLRDARIAARRASETP